jgi:hypothetical protein
MKHRLGIAASLFGISLAVSLTTAAPATADPETTVEIRIDNTSSGRELAVKNRGVGVCKSGKCSASITWHWKKGDERPGEKIVIQHSGGTPGSEKCFEQRYEIQEPKSEISATVSADCPGGKSAWFYDIRCETASGSSCGIPPVDPGVIIEGGPPGT